MIFSQIAQSLRTFGIAATTTNLLAIKVSTDPSITASTVSDHLAISIQGSPVDFSDASLASMVDIAKIRKLYKLGGVGESESKGKRRRKTDSEEGVGAVNELSDERRDVATDKEKKELEVAILGLMALRGAV